MKYVKSLKASLAIGNILCIVLVIISSIINGIDSDRSPLILVLVAILITPLVLLIIYGLRAYQNKNDARSYFILLAISALIVLFQLIFIYPFIINFKYFLKYFHYICFSIIMLLLWVLNVIAYLNRAKWQNK
jgi:hypothetical protein